MIGLLVSAVMWPPGYYIWRDRAPFFLTVLYLYRHMFPGQAITLLGWTLTLFIGLVTGVAFGLYLKGSSMRFLAGISWSAPSPIEWGIMILVITVMLYSREIMIFESFYLAFITAMGGGWLYEFTPLLFQPGFNPFVFFKINAVKVFFIEFQLFCIPILIYLINTTKQYRQNRLLTPAALFFLVFTALNHWIIQWVQTNLIYSYRWYVRLPAMLFLFSLVYGIKGDKPRV